MKRYKILNNSLGWLCFAIATLTYFLTLEPTASWWDCGEYISTAVKLQVGHPPGAPTFQLLGRFFSLFAFGDITKQAMMVNAMSAISSSLTILFLFWTITMLGRKIVNMSNPGETYIAADGSIQKGCDFDKKENSWKMYSIFAAGAIGALAYTFSDTFWFSAVEGEVYAMSSFCTAIVFWAILKWELQTNEQDANRWLLFIALILGLSIGVHLLNLLAIPAIALIYYHKNFTKHDTKGTLATIAISFALIAIILYGIVPFIVRLAGSFDLFFVNRLNMPINTGTIVFFVLLIALVAAAWIWSLKKKSTIWNTIVVSFALLLVGYSTFFILAIRSNTNTPINEGSPSDPITMLSYLNREQYGSAPLVYGPYYNAPIVDYKDGKPIYVKDDASSKYIMTEDNKDNEPVYDKRFCTLLPRMYYNDPAKIEGYKSWGKIKGERVTVTNMDGSTQQVYKPTFAENLRYMFRYQFGHMYMRYFLWNFVGRQNNIEGHGGIQNGNWKSGINFIDEIRLGEQKLPDSLDNPANNNFYFLPLILGLIGMFFHIKKNPKDALVVFMLFFMTGMAIILYSNQKTYEPRERDYAYAGSFYAFAIWIGLGVLSVINWLNKVFKEKKTMSVAVATVICLIVPTIMAQQGWDDHDRSGKYAARDFGKNYFAGLLPNSIIISNGDNDTFPLWYVQEVENCRTDVRVMNYMLSASEWYAPQMMRKVYDSDPVPFTMKKEDYYKGVNEIAVFADKGINQAIDIKDFIKLFSEGKLNAKFSDGKYRGTFPCKKFKLKVDKEKVLANGIVPPELADKIVDEIVWTVNTNFLTKNDILFFDFLASFDWDRPLYITTPNIVNKVFNADKYWYLDGIVYRLMPVECNDATYISGIGGVDVDRSYDVLMNKVTWGNLNDPTVTVDRESMRNCMMMRQDYIRLAVALSDMNKHDSAVKVIDKALEFFPNHTIQCDYLMLSCVEMYFKANEREKAIELAEIIHKKYLEEAEYYLAQKERFSDYFYEDLETAISCLVQLTRYMRTFNETELYEQYNSEVQLLIGMV